MYDRIYVGLLSDEKDSDMETDKLTYMYFWIRTQLEL